MVTDMTVWALIYFFIFEIRAVVDLLESTTPIMYALKKARTKSMLVTFLSLTTSLSVGYHAVAAMRIFGAREYWMKVVGTSCRCIYLAMFVLIVSLWIRLTIKIIKKKQEKIQSK